MIREEQLELEQYYQLRKSLEYCLESLQEAAKPTADPAQRNTDLRIAFDNLSELAKEILEEIGEKKQSTLCGEHWHSPQSDDQKTDNRDRYTEIGRNLLEAVDKLESIEFDEVKRKTMMAQGWIFEGLNATAYADVLWYAVRECIKGDAVACQAVVDQYTHWSTRRLSVSEIARLTKKDWNQMAELILANVRADDSSFWADLQPSYYFSHLLNVARQADEGNRLCHDRMEKEAEKWQVPLNKCTSWKDEVSRISDARKKALETPAESL